jgi:hypothetical protein
MRLKCRSGSTDEDHHEKIGLAVILVAPLGAGTTLTVTAQTAPAGLSGQLGAAADSLNMLEQTQYIYGGRRYCWYFDGWRGPGWYRCGYARRHGLGWGGGTGWQGWQQGVRPQGRQHQESLVHDIDCPRSHQALLMLLSNGLRVYCRLQDQRRTLHEKIAEYYPLRHS